jgi:senataxin
MKDWTTRKYHTQSLFRPFVFYDVLSGRQSQVSGSKSLRNVNEVVFILWLLHRLVVGLYPEIDWRRKIGIIAPYKQQIVELRSELQQWERGMKHALEIEVNTVDGLGDHYLLVCAYFESRTPTSYGSKTTNIDAFWADERPMNVAITRAKCSLWIVGNSSLLEQSTAWRTLIHHAHDSKRQRHRDRHECLHNHRYQ